MNPFVIDVNVPMVANNQAPQADNKCVQACVKALGRVYKNGKVFIDDGDWILEEYKKNLKVSGSIKML